MSVSKQIPSIKNWGGVRRIQERLGGSTTIAKNREAVAYALLTIANTKLTDIMEWDETGNIKVKASKDIPEHAQQAIKSIKVNERYDKEGGCTRTLDIELYDKVGVLRILAKASGLLDTVEDSDKPSVIGINVKAPEIIDAEEVREQN
jgi:hypothetical protein